MWDKGGRRQRWHAVLSNPEVLQEALRAHLRHRDGVVKGRVVALLSRQRSKSQQQPAASAGGGGPAVTAGRVGGSGIARAQRLFARLLARTPFSSFPRTRARLKPPSKVRGRLHIASRNLNLSSDDEEAADCVDLTNEEEAPVPVAMMRKRKADGRDPAGVVSGLKRPRTNSTVGGPGGPGSPVAAGKLSRREEAAEASDRAAQERAEALRAKQRRRDEQRLVKIALQVQRGGGPGARAEAV